MVELFEKTDAALQSGFDFSACDGIYNRRIKRILGFLLAVVLFLTLFPVYLLVGLAVAVDSGFPVLYRAERGGFKGKTFQIYKFRTMVQGADRIGGGTTKLGDSRITRIGGFLRKTKLDEITQLINIIKGEMSFIGPRPELLKYVQAYSGAEKNILKVRPGITDYSSLHYINLDQIVGGENADEMYEKYVLKQKNQLRVKYAQTVSFQTDIVLFIRTVAQTVRNAFAVLLGKKADDGNHLSKKL